MFRYKKFKLRQNDLRFYSKQLKARGKKNIVQIQPRPLGVIPEDVKRQLTILETVWTTDTKLYKLADQYYGDQDLWWVIGYYNNKPIDASWNVGEKVLIPTPVSLILDTLEL